MDRVTLEVIGAALLTIAEEMGTALIKSSYSTNIKERQDCSTAIFDARGRGHRAGRAHPDAPGLAARASSREVLARYPAATLAPGDVFISNDPYTGGGTHLPDINLVSPVFADGALFGFVANIAHHADRSGERIRTIWDEGLRITPIRLAEARAHARGRDGAPARQLRAARRAPRGLPRPDRGQPAGRAPARRADRAATALATVARPAPRSLAYGERKIRAAIAALPDGVYRFADAMDGDGVAPEPIPIAVTITKRGDALALDFAGSGPQCAGDINVVYFALLATVYYALKAVLDPTIPANGGFYRAIARHRAGGQHRQRAAARAGGVAHPDLPAHRRRGARRARPGRARARARGRQRRELRHGLLAAPIRAPASSTSTSRRSPAAPARTATGDGMDAVQVHVTNTSNLPVEALEIGVSAAGRPSTRWSRAAAGAGRHRGGLGLRRTIEVLGHEARFLGTTERARLAPWGLVRRRARRPRAPRAESGRAGRA